MGGLERFVYLSAVHGIQFASTAVFAGGIDELKLTVKFQLLIANSDASVGLLVFPFVFLSVLGLN